MRDAADRYDGLAEAYAAFRPGYPESAFRDIAADVTCPLRRVIDVGAGPGNSTLALRAALGPDWTIAAVEPGRDMRRVLTRRLEGSAGILILDACAEALPLPPGFASLITVCTAWPWLDPGATLAQAARVLAPGGVLAVLRNRRLDHPVIAAFDAYFAARSLGGEEDRHHAARALPAPDWLATRPGFAQARSGVWGWQQPIDTRGLIDLWLTRSTAWAVVRRIGLDRVLADLADLGARHLPGGQMVMGWQTQAHWVRRV